MRCLLYTSYCKNFLLSLGMEEEHMRLREHAKEELSHYSKGTTDIEFLFPFGWGELWGVADRTDFDLKQHMEHSGENFEYVDPTNGNKFIPYCVEPSLGADRVALAFLCDAYDEEELEGGDVRTVLPVSYTHLASFTAISARWIISSESSWRSWASHPCGWSLRGGWPNLSRPSRSTTFRSAARSPCRVCA